MITEDKRKNDKYNAIGLLLPIIMILGHSSIRGLRIAGLMLTPFRVCVPLAFVTVLFKILAEEKKTIINLFKENKYTVCMSIVIFIWLIYGGLSLSLSQYSAINTGIKELLAILLSAMSLLCIISVCKHGGWNWLIIGTKLATVITICIAFYEITTGNHLSTSRFCSPEFFEVMEEILNDNSNELRFYLATSTFYNENDYSAFLAVMTPLFSVDITNKERKQKIEGFIMLGLITYIIYVNDAFICLLAIIVGVTCTLAFSHAKLKAWIGAAVTMMVSSVLAKLISGAGSLEASLVEQVNLSQNETGSLLFRINTYIVSIRETVFTSKGLGFGAGSYANYFAQFAEMEKMMSNPHCLWIEILSEYGIIVFVMFVSVLVATFVALIQANKKEKNIRYAMILGAGASFILASMSPSSYLQYAYYWIPIALALYLADAYEAECKDHKKLV